MKALVYNGPGRRSWTDHSDPEIIAPTDAIVRIDAVTICGTDLHILKGDVPEVKPGRALGHEAVGTIVRAGDAVTIVRPGDRVLVSCISACGRCEYCRRGAYGQCLGGGGWTLGHLVDGVQAEFARVPFADTSTYPLPASVSDESALLLADIIPTSYEIGVRNGRVGPGDVVVIVGAGPIGLAAVTAARLYSPASIVVIDKETVRLEAAEAAGADRTALPDQAEATVWEVGGGLGADVAIEAVGVPETFELCAELVRPGGRIANIGVHGKPATLHLERLWARDVTITTGLVDTWSTPMLLRMLAAGRLNTERLITHRFGLQEMDEAYDVFAHPQDSGALKVALFRE
ncbi:zinc-dependent alcohol dehydrogenase family protein [Amycolatopsis panacis]|uniref:Alcohol dehydrogenase n=1 Tax=Amycolatopsis panacis TaxID=2340917 RepID=A0A419I6W1_9PSEU|nr:zinc-dependent alcohol dehydrogenase family protein [Amycolatopsis panacis]RJQ87271.1 alcohol dehydrogenase [Amycolatopsis panacis]